MFFRAVLFLLAASALATAADPGATLNSELPNWLRLGGEYRGRFEGFTGRLFQPGNDDHYFLNRYRLSLTIKPLSWVQVVGQVQDAHIFWNTRAADAPPFQDRFDLRMAYVELGQIDKSKYAVRVGRQEITFGEERLVGASNWANTARTFDAVRASIRQGPNSLDVFASSVVGLRDGEWNHHVDGDDLHGAFGSLEKLVPGARIQPFAFWRLAPRVVAETGRAGHLDFKTYGIFWNGTLPRGFDYKWEAAMQRGDWSTDSVQAWAGHWRVGRSWAKRRFTPRVTQEYNYATGDKDPADHKRGTFDVLYPTPHDKYGLADQIGWRNIHHLGSVVQFQPRKNLTVQGKYHSWWLASVRDGVYNAGGVLLVRDAKGLSGRFVGQELDAQVLWSPMKPLNLGFGLGHLFPGEFLKKASPGASYTFPYMSLTYGF